MNSEPQAGRLSYRVPVVLSLAGLLIVLVSYLELHLGSGPPTMWVYWAGILLTVVPGLLSRHPVAAKLGLAIFAFLQCFGYLLSAPYGLVYFRDPIYNLQLANVVAQTGIWRVGQGTYIANAYSYYPGSNLFNEGLAASTNLPVASVYLFATGALRFAVIPLALYGIFRRFLKPLPSQLALATYLAAPSNLFNLPIQQEFAIVFALLGLYASLLASSLAGTRRLSPAALVSSFFFLTTVAVSHHLTSYIFIAVTSVLAVASFIPQKGPPDGSPHQGPLFLLAGFRYTAPAFAYVFFLWSLYVSSPVDLFFLEFIETNFQRAFESGSLSRPGGAASSGVQAGYTYTSAELALTALSLIILVSSAFLGAILLARRAGKTPQPKRGSAYALLALFLVALILTFGAAPLIFSRGLFVPLRMIEFSGLGIVPFTGIVLAYGIRRRTALSTGAVIVAISILIVGGSLLQPSNPRFYYLPANAVYCEVPTHLTNDVLSATEWAKGHLSYRSRVFGDDLVLDAFGGYGAFDVAPEHTAYPLFNATVVNQTIARAVELRKGDYVVVHRFMGSSICFPSFRATPLEPEKLLKFSADSSFERIFQSGSVTIYSWRG